MTHALVGFALGAVLFTAGVAFAEDQPLYYKYQSSPGSATYFGSDGTMTTVYQQPGSSMGQYFTQGRNGSSTGFILDQTLPAPLSVAPSMPGLFAPPHPTVQRPERGSEWRR